MITNSPEKRAHSNLLARESSPYLRQHAENPVGWHPWGEPAFELARRQDKPIFLSIGYSTCHWCHVMERESFCDDEVAKLLNDGFIAVKVDREERPDIDQIYMSVCQMLTGSGGWPLTIVMTPDQKPFFAGTYFPRESRWGRPGLLELLPNVANVWRTQREQILTSADDIAVALQDSNKTSLSTPQQIPDLSLLDSGYDQLQRAYDAKNGGFGNEPKFPTPQNLLFLLRYGRRRAAEPALAIVEKTLTAMRLGGIYDQIGYGFHRYSTDAEWRTPHFEKMLYDQALLCIAYLEAYQAIKNPEFLQTAQELCTYVLRDLTDSEGGFYSAEDADSEGIEGKFYVWTAEELRAVLAPELSDLAIRLYGVTAAGNFPEGGAGANVLRRAASPAEIAKALGLDLEEFQKFSSTIREQLFRARQQRQHPPRDEKILTDWNGLMIAALSRAAQVCGENRYLEAAQRAADFVLAQMRTSAGGLLHRYYQGNSGVGAFLDDYAFLVWGLLELYEVGFEKRYLEEATELNAIMLGRFWDVKAGGFYFTAADSETLLWRKKELYDGALPSGNSVALSNLLKLARFTGNFDLDRRAEQLAQTFASQVHETPGAYAFFLCGLDFAWGPAHEVVIAGELQGEDTQAMLRVLRQEFLPNKIVLLRPPEQETPEGVRQAGFQKRQMSFGGQATAYICQNHQCKLPTTDPEALLKMLKA